MTVQLVSVTLQIVWEMSQICELPISAYIQQYHTYQNDTRTQERMTQERAGQSLQIEHGVYVTE